MAQWVRSLDLTAYTSLSPIQHGFVPRFVNYKNGCTRLAAASDKVYQSLAQGRWFSPVTPTSSNTKTGCHDIAEILVKVALNTKNQIIKSNPFWKSLLLSNNLTLVIRCTLQYKLKLHNKSKCQVHGSYCWAKLILLLNNT